MFCRNCGNQLPEGAGTCPRCGTPAGTGSQFCPNCGAPVVPGSSICPNCGYMPTYAAGDAPQQPQPQQPQPQQPQQQPQQPPYQQPPYQQPQQPYQQPPTYQQPPYQQPFYLGQKSKMAAGLLGIFLGSLGIHNFYLGYTGKAVAQLLITVCTCGFGAVISGIWGFVEGIMILTGSICVDARGIPLKD